MHRRKEFKYYLENRRAPAPFAKDRPLAPVPRTVAFSDAASAALFSDALASVAYLLAGSYTLDISHLSVLFCRSGAGPGSCVDLSKCMSRRMHACNHPEKTSACNVTTSLDILPSLPSCR